MAGDIGEVLALDDERLLDLSRPVTPDGRIKSDRVRVREREDAQLRAALDAGSVTLIVPGRGTRPVGQRQTGRGRGLRVHSGHDEDVRGVRRQVSLVAGRTRPRTSAAQGPGVVQTSTSSGSYSTA